MALKRLVSRLVLFFCSKIMCFNLRRKERPRALQKHRLESKLKNALIPNRKGSNFETKILNVRYMPIVWPTHLHFKPNVFSMCTLHTSGRSKGQQCCTYALPLTSISQLKVKIGNLQNIDRILEIELEIPTWALNPIWFWGVSYWLRIISLHRMICNPRQIVSKSFLHMSTSVTSRDNDPLLSNILKTFHSDKSLSCCTISSKYQKCEKHKSGSEIVWRLRTNSRYHYNMTSLYKPPTSIQANFHLVYDIQTMYL